MVKNQFNLQAPKRLRAMAREIAAGKSLTDVAAKFRVPATALQRVAVPKKRTQRLVLDRELLNTVAERIREGDTFAKAAAALNVDTVTLTVAMRKHGLTAKSLRPSRSPKMSLAIGYYKEGVAISEIARRTGYAVATLYNNFREQGVTLRGQKRGSKKDSP